MEDTKTYWVKIKCNTCGETWDEEGYEDPETGATVLIDEEGGWICPNCDVDGDTEVDTIYGYYR